MGIGRGSFLPFSRKLHFFKVIELEIIESFPKPIINLFKSEFFIQLLDNVLWVCPEPNVLSILGAFEANFLSDIEGKLVESDEIIHFKAVEL